MNKKNLWRTINAGFLVCIGLFGIGSFLGIAALQFRHILIAFAMLFLLAAFGSVPLRGKILLFAGMLFALFGAGMAAGGRNVLLLLQTYFYWLTDNPLWYPEWVMGYELVQAAFFALFCYVVQIVMEKDFRFKIAGILAVFSVLMYFLLAKKELPRLGVVFMLCYALMLYVEWTQVHWKKEKQKSVQAYMLWLMPFLVAYFGLMFLPKMPEEPYDWQIVKSVYGQLRESFLKFSINYLRGDDEDYDLSLSGFSERGRLEGRNEETQRELMVIESKSGRSFNLYLTGKVYDTFDGRQWEQKSGDTMKGRYIDTAETLCAVKRYDEEYQTDYLANLDVKIRYQYFHSEFLFAPLKMSGAEQKFETLDFREIGGSLYFNGKNGYGTEYEVSFYQLNAGEDAFREFLEEASVPQEEDLDELLAVLEETTGERIGKEEIQRYRQEIYDDYQESVVLTDGVEEYLQKITTGAESDVEMLMALETELASFTYTRTPGELPETVDSSGEFLDYFLLESREGYCTYFATAFVLLARAEGLPARYVQGFCVPVGNRGETMVYSNMAHAWPEVYFEGIGWIPFEPTPGYSEMRYTTWATRRGRVDSTEEADAQSVQSGENEGVFEQSDEEAWQEQQQAAFGEKGRLKRFVRFFGLVVLWLLSAALLIFLLNRLLVRFRYRKMDLTAKFRAEVERNQRLLALMGIKRGQEETLKEFGKRAGAILDEENALQFLQSYEDFVYGDKEVEQSMLDETKRQQEELGEILKRKKRWAYLYYRLMYL